MYVKFFFQALEADKRKVLAVRASKDVEERIT